MGHNPLYTIQSMLDRTGHFIVTKNMSHPRYLDYLTPINVCGIEKYHEGHENPFAFDVNIVCNISKSDDSKQDNLLNNSNVKHLNPI